MKDLFVILFILNALIVNAQTNPQIEGYGTGVFDKVLAGTAHTYKIVWNTDPDKITKYDKENIRWEIINGTIKQYNDNIPSIDVIWKEDASYGKLFAHNVKDTAYFRKYVSLEEYFTLHKKSDPFDLDEGYSGEPLILHISNNTPRQFERIELRIEEHYRTSIKGVDWYIDDKSYSSQIESKNIYFPTTGLKKISATIHYKDTTAVHEISKTINVSPGSPTLSKIYGQTNIGPGSQCYYSESNHFSQEDVDYIWEVRPNRGIMIENLNETISIIYELEGFYNITCQVKDKRTGILSNTVQLRVNVSSDYGILKTKNKCKIEINDRTISINPINQQNSSSLSYRISNAFNGNIISQGKIDSQSTIIKLSSFHQGFFILTVLNNNSIIQSQKFTIK